MNTMVFPNLKETFQPEKMSFDVSRKDIPSPLAKGEREKKSEFAATLEKVTTQHKEKPATEKRPSEKIQDIREKVEALLQHPEKQTEENITEVLEALLSFLNQGTASLSPGMKQEASELLSSLREMVLAWEKGKLSNEDFLKHFLGWIDEMVSSPFGNLKTTLPTENPKAFLDQENSQSPQRESTPSQDKNSSLARTSETQKEQEKPLIRLIDKRTYQPTTGEKPLSESLSLKESFSSKIESLLKQIDPKEGIFSPIAKPIQDFGVKTAPALPSLPRVSVEQMLQQVAGKALITLRDGQSEMRLQLTPPDLGRMEMKIVLEDGQMMGKIVVSTPEAKALFDQNLGELQRQLQQAGVQVGSLDVSLGQPGDDKQPEPALNFSVHSFQGEGEVIATEGITSSSLWTDTRVNYIV